MAASRDDEQVFAHESPVPINPVLMKIMSEIGDDDVLAEAILAYVRKIKPAVTMAKLQVLYAPEELQAMIERLEGTPA